MTRIKPAIRTALNHPFIDNIVTQVRCSTGRREIDNFLRAKNVFFVLGVGRSGTKFLAKLLDQDETATVLHEPVRADFQAVVAAHESGESASRYISGFRKKKIYCLARARGTRTYGEVNSALRFHARALGESIPDVKLMHLARDGRDVVRSIMGRGHYTDDRIGHHSISPTEDDPLFRAWDDMTRFERVCWLWADGNRRVREQVAQLVRFEDLTSDYAFFRENVADPLSVIVSREAWADAVHTPVNVSKDYAIPHWTRWGPALKHSFWAVCGDEMSALGYA